ncbi:MAG: hypothetical protein ACRD0W_21015 [Acidimicrobiales bacterium]
MTEFLSIAWPGLLVFAGMLALIVHAVRGHRRRYPKARYSIRRTGPRGVVVPEVRHELTERQAREVAALARALVDEPETRRG